ncbi:MAG: TetR/AcrR family transcriptional regulator [Micromonosporaceae bacterium]
MATRKYVQRLRADAAEQTRRRILDAVYERLRTAPAERVSLDQVARIAGVARSTVYLIFGSRAGLFEAIGVDLLQHGGFDELMRAVTDPDAREALRGSIHASTRMYATNRDLLRALHSMALLDPEAYGGAIARMEDGRAAGMAHHARRLAEQDALLPGLSRDDAAHLLCLLTSFDSFDALHTGRSLPVTEVADLLLAAAERGICRPGRG